MEAKVKTLRSQLDEIGAVLEAIPAPLDRIPAVIAFQQLHHTTATPAACFASALMTKQDSSTTRHGSGSDSSAATAADAAAGSVLDWSALPAAVAPDSMAMGVSTRKKAAYKPPKKAVDQQKVQARAERKRAQVESFLLVLQPVLQAAGHNLAAAAVQEASNSSTQQSCSSGMQGDQPSPDPQQRFQTSYQSQQQQEQQRQCMTQPQQQLRTQPLSLHIVDFGCGSGNLLLPLAALLPGCQFTGIDMKPAALKLLMQRAADAGLRNVSVFEGMIEQYKQPFDVALALHACGNATDHVLQMAVDQRAAFVVSPCCVGKLRFSLTGGSSFHSKPITWTPTQPGDRPVQAQADGVSPPAPQQKQQQQQPEQPQRHQQKQSQQQPQQQQQQQQRAPSCAGPLNLREQHEGQQPQLQEQQHQQQQQQHQQQQHQQQQQQQQQQGDGVVRKLRHPRSDWLMAQLPDPEQHFKIMAKVADVSHAPSDRAELAEALKQPRMNVADMCKRFVELDRCAAAAEAGYAVGLFKVLQADSMAKNDLLVGLPLPPVNSCVRPPAATRASSATATAAACASSAASSASSGSAAKAVAADGVSPPSGDMGADQAGLCTEDIRSCFCRCGEALHAKRLLFAKDRLCADCRLESVA